MRILVVCQYYYPEPFKITEICENLVQRGHIVTVLTGLPNYPDGIIPFNYRSGKLRKEVINSVNVIRCFEIPRKKGAMSLGLNYVSYMISASLKSLFLKDEFDIIFVYQLSPVLMVYPAVLFKWKTKKPIYLYCCDIWPESMKIYINNEKSILYKLIKNISTYLYSKCDAISVTSPAFIEYFMKEHKSDSREISYLPQHADDLYSTADLSLDNGVIDFMFMGTIGIAQDIDCILSATELVRDIPNLRVHFVGDGSYAEIAKLKVSEMKLDDIIVFHGRYPSEKMIDFYKIADVCLLTLKSDNLIGFTVPAKLQGYMSAGKIIIGAINGAAQDIIRESRCGLCVNSGDVKGLAKAMRAYAENPYKYRDCGKNGKEYFLKHFTKSIYMEQLEKKLTELLRRR